MAEARSAVHSIRLGTVHLESVSTKAKLRGPQTAPLDGGIIIVIPAPKYLLRQLQIRLRYLWNATRHASWPLPMWGLMLVMAAFLHKVLHSPSDSWYRDNRLAKILWDLDVYVMGNLGLAKIVPLWVRISYLAVYTAFAVLLLLAFVNRLMMRMLLKYQGWMVEKKTSFTTMAWGALMQFYFAFDKHPLTFTYQSAMPRLSVPPIKTTISRFLKSVRPVLTDDEYNEYEKAANSFVRKEGPRLQAMLVAKSFYSTNYVSDWWEKYVYLRGRSPILINSNYYGLGFNNYIPTSSQVSRAATLMYHYMRFKQLLDSQQLRPMTIRGVVPICMRQYERIFQTTRVPGRDTDVNVHLDPGDSIHIALLYKGGFWKVNVVGDDGVIVPAHELEKRFRSIVELSDDAKSPLRAPAADSAEACLPALTGIERTRWAEHREQYFMDGINKISLDEIESAIIVLHLDDRAPQTWSETANLSLHGNGTTRWCDKSFNLIVFANGQASVHAEHSWADAPVIAHAWEWVLASETNGNSYTNGMCTVAAPKPPPGGTPRSPPRVSKAQKKAEEEAGIDEGVSRLYFDLSAEAKKAVLDAKDFTKKLCEDLQLIVVCHRTSEGGYGKGFIKKQKCSPDAWIQMALQLAWQRDQGRFSLTYEAAAVRLFNEGRTETIRSCTSDTKNFVTLMDDPKASKEDRIKALRAAANTHVALSRESSVGRGVDRHIFCLYVGSLALNMNVKFLKDALSMPWQLSTSQIPQRQTEGMWGKDTSDDMWSPSGGFGPVSDEGYGVSYMMASDDMTFFHISCKNSCKKTDSERFKMNIWKAFADMRALFD
mmetsp:Transcript_5605/g.10883  ORF Transcript_5605/g.10883 Transcript_5605/m.10883 type:complete len:824 (-) Transcript_5605:763-3234(-)|eukprot:CAMPEP_0173393572 /NCGR_PEP_ID=MMETSP1356-20130122/22182_1 /TAXON_ID=77927 ORGANISM="Hemiselmis virescens, Strain PCC157" /NCGR_SAMPLE_ID=MMETSP1356 /ASSEMBLY_ACC=CAM_ASM_000847 /LENGTH=823 /DNA_ID=CAMNT_0014351613 /DNA_START=55 /DNA_END=2526 /DNA_ORIENTATION=+